MIYQSQSALALFPGTLPIRSWLPERPTAVQHPEALPRRSGLTVVVANLVLKEPGVVITTAVRALPETVAGTTKLEPRFRSWAIVATVGECQSLTIG